MHGYGPYKEVQETFDGPEHHEEPHDVHKGDTKEFIERHQIIPGLVEEAVHVVLVQRRPRVDAMASWPSWYDSF